MIVHVLGVPMDLGSGRRCQHPQADRPRDPEIDSLTIPHWSSLQPAGVTEACLTVPPLMHATSGVRANHAMHYRSESGAGRDRIGVALDGPPEPGDAQQLELPDQSVPNS